MKAIIVLYILNAMLLILHEIESGYEKEWEIFRLPIKITGFLIIHIPILFLIFYGLLELEKQTKLGFILSMIIGFGGAIPFLVHKVFVKRKEHFNLVISNSIIYLNLVAGIATLVLAASDLLL